MEKSEVRNLFIPALAELLADPTTDKTEAAFDAPATSTAGQWRRCRQVLDLNHEVPKFADARALENALREII